MNLKLRILLFFFGLWAFKLSAQSVENIRITVDGEKVKVTYDLLHANPGDRFKVFLFSSHDNYATPLTLVIGDVGEGLFGGAGKLVIWDAKNTLPADYDGDISVRVKAELINPVMDLAPKPLIQSTYKRGNSISVQWVGGRPNDKIKIELFKGSELQQKVVEDLENKQTYQWVLPKNLRKGKDYSFHISSGAEQSIGEQFAVKPKVPLLLKLIPVAVIAGVVAILIKPDTDPVSELSDLPGPVKPN